MIHRVYLTYLILGLEVTLSAGAFYVHSFVQDTNDHDIVVVHDVVEYDVFMLLNDPNDEVACLAIINNESVQIFLCLLTCRHAYIWWIRAGGVHRDNLRNRFPCLSIDFSVP